MHTLIIGIDGADPDLIKKWKTKLPNINRVPIRKYETYDNSGPSWAAVLTGLKPEEHHIGAIKVTSRLTGFMDRLLWRNIKEKRVGVMGVPLTYPPDEHIRGWIVSGMLTPKDVIYTHPSRLSRELDDLGYKIHIFVKETNQYAFLSPETSQERIVEYFEYCKEMVRKRAEGFCYLNTTYPVDVGFIVFSATDTIGHLAFGNKAMLYDIYACIDNAVGSILDTANYKNLILLSDHGFARKRNPHNPHWGKHRKVGIFGTNRDDGKTVGHILDVYPYILNVVNEEDEALKERFKALGYM
jgi:predicted AlkP superfamily phosphohydrolase/phosphomutase